MKFLKVEHRVTHSFANAIITLSKDTNESDDDLVNSQYKGKEKLLPIYNKLIAVVSSLGTDVVKTPKKTTVSIIRKKQFALIKPASKSRIDLGLKLKNTPTTRRLENSGPFGSMCTHRVKLASASEVDDELVSWLKEAYVKAN